MTQGWGSGKWGSSKWGSGVTPPIVAPVITPLDPINNDVDIPQSKPITFRVIDEVGAVLSTLIVAVNGINYIIGGSEQNGAIYLATANSGNGFDIELTLPEKMPLGSRQEVYVFVKDTSDIGASIQYFFTVGAGVRLLEVKNPQPGILVAYFNRPMRLDSTFLFAENWRVAAVTKNAPILTITEVLARAGSANASFLKYEGGGSTYLLTVFGVYSQDGDPLQSGYNSAEFELLYGAEEDSVIRLFDTIFGPIGMSQQLIHRRTMDEHVINRSMATGMDEQFRLRFQAVDRTGSRAGLPGERRS